MINRREHIHFIGIGGVGMFPMAEVLHRTGYKVTGSDAQVSSAVDQLRNWGLEVQVGHEPRLVQNAQIVVYSSAVPESNPEMIAARASGAVVMKRAVMLGDLMRKAFSIGVAGTHGKTTTTSLIAKVLECAGKNPTVVVGGVFRGSDTVSGAMVGDGTLLVCEADEYDRSFLQMYPSVAVITNIEEDHLDIYKDIHEIREAFEEYANRVPFYGQVLGCIDTEEVRNLLAKLEKPVTTYGYHADAHFRLEEVTVSKGVSCSRVYERGTLLGEMEVPLLGNHNQLNALAAVAIARSMDIDFEVICQALRAFPGVKRRMEILGEVSGVTIIDDYAHHPTEVEATVNAITRAGFNNVRIIFQPHLYSRTQECATGFAQALESDLVESAYVLPIYKAREEPIEGVENTLITDQAGESVYAVSSFDEVVSIAIDKSNPGDVVLVMGAGDVWKVGHQILEELK